MSFDSLQARIRALKSPIVAELDLRPENLPPALLARHTGQCGQTLQAAVQAAEEFGLLLIEGLWDAVPAVSFSVPSFELLGWRGLAVLEKLIACAKQKGLFVIADAQRGGLGPAAAAYSAAWLGGARVGNTFHPVFDADCLTVNGYLGSDCLKPFLECCIETDKCALVVVKMPGPSSVELEDLVAGDRLVHTAVGDLAGRLARDSAGKQYGFGALGAVVGTPYPVEMKQLRRRLDRVFFLVPCCDTDGDMEVAQHAFNEYGRGAAVCVGSPILGACRSVEADFSQAVHAAAEEQRRKWKNLVTIL